MHTLITRPLMQSVAMLVLGTALSAAAHAGTSLHLVQAAPYTGDRGQDVALSPGGEHVYVAAGDGISVYERDPLSGEVNFVESQTTGVCVQGLVGAACETDIDCMSGGKGECHEALGRTVAVTVSPDGSCVYAGADSGKGVTIFGRDQVSGALSLVGFRGAATCFAGKVGMRCSEDVTCDSVPGAGDGLCLYWLRAVPDVAVSPDDAHVYVVEELEDIIAFSRTPPGCDLGLVQHIRNGADGVTGLTLPTAVAIAPDGAHVYAATRADDSVVIFDRNPVTGELSQVGVEFAGECTTGPNTGASCDGAADCGGGACTVNVEPLFNPRDLVVTADGAHLYVAARGLPVFSRDAGTGLLSLASAGDLDAFDLGSARAVAVSPGGDHVYRAGGGLLVVFTRDAGTGETSPLHTQDGGRGVAVSGDDAFVYAVGGHPDVAVYDLLPTIECTSTPAAGCGSSQEPGRSTIVIKDGANDKRDRMIWKWRQGEATSLAEFGDVTGTDSLAFCAYDESGPGGTSELVLQVLAGPDGVCSFGAHERACWELKRERLRYKSKNRIPDGADFVSLRGGEEGKPSIKFRGSKEPLRTPVLPLSGTVTVQLQSSGGLCWAAQYSTAVRNDATQYKAVAD